MICKLPKRFPIGCNLWICRYAGYAVWGVATNLKLPTVPLTMGRLLFLLSMQYGCCHIKELQWKLQRPWQSKLHKSQSATLILDRIGDEQTSRNYSACMLLLPVHGAQHKESPNWTDLNGYHPVANLVARLFVITHPRALMNFFRNLGSEKTEQTKTQTNK